MLNILLDNRNGMMWDISGIVSSVSYKSSRVGKASSLDMTLVRDGIYQSTDFVCNVGDVVRVEQNGTTMFYGYIFTIDSGRDERIQVTAFDQLRYLSVKDSRILKEMTVNEMIQQFATEFELRVGYLEETQYVLPPTIEDNTTLLDMICNALSQTLLATGRHYLFFDDGGELTLRSLESMALDLSLGDGSLLYDFQQTRSIDDSYNVVKLLQVKQERGERLIYMEQDSSNIAKWGRLQYFKTVDEKMNEAQIVTELHNWMKLKNREGRKMKLDAIGDARVRGGSLVSVNLAQYGVQQYFMVDSCTHKIEGVDHTMQLDLVDIRIGDAPF